MRKLVGKYQSTIHGNYSRMSLRYGILIGIIMIVVLMIRYLSAYKPSSPMTLWDNITLLITMAICVYHYRSSLENKKITFKEGWLVGFYSGCVAAILFGVFLYLYSNSIDTEMSLRCANVLRRIQDYASYTEEQFAEMTKPSVLAVQSMIYNAIMAVLWAFLVAIILKNEDAKQIIKEK
ncbi:MAG: DUF4199 domain-containing protein [Bacteroidales bacterium]|nr:DUF4199 domain-containing protein [Bacteroidales bacterium]